jgi:NNP family nitrate/nitrite transporter-like MFS transporter
VLSASELNSFPIFVVGFIVLFVFSGIGNGSTYKMIPSIFHAKAQLEVGAGIDLAEADAVAIRRSGALIGLAGAIGPLGGVLVNLAFRQSFLTLKNGDGAYIAFIACYGLCFAVTWAAFMRRHSGRLEGV